MNSLNSDLKITAHTLGNPPYQTNRIGNGLDIWVWTRLTSITKVGVFTVLFFIAMARSGAVRSHGRRNNIMSRSENLRAGVCCPNVETELTATEKRRLTATDQSQLCVDISVLTTAYN